MWLVDNKIFEFVGTAIVFALIAYFFWQNPSSLHEFIRAVLFIGIVLSVASVFVRIGTGGR